MKILKKIFGKSDVKIHVDEIAVSSARLLGSAVIVSTGDNVNGEWVKFGDGTMICRRKMVLGPINTASGALFVSANHEWTYPQPFLDGSVQMTGYVKWGWANVWLVSSSKNASSSVGTFRLLCSHTVSSTDIGLELTAIGRWK